MDDDTVNRIISMINARRTELNAEWDALQKGTLESGAILKAYDALGDLKWAIVDEQNEALSDPDLRGVLFAPKPDL
jgi:hypothetical protein